MDRVETGRILLLMKSCWQDQATGDDTINLACEIFRGVSFAAAREAVIAWSKAGLERPTLGKVYQEALKADSMGLERARAMRKGLSGPLPDAEQQEKNKRVLRDMIDKIGEKMKL